MSNLPASDKKKKSFHFNLKSFSLRAQYTKKYFFYFMFIVIFLIPLFLPNHVLKAAATGQYIQSPSTSFSFTAGGDIGGNSSSSTALDLIAQSGSQFHLAIGDLSYSEITLESKWCSYVQSRVGSTFPFELLSGNHEDGGEPAGQDGSIDNFVQCLPDRLGAVGTYGKEYYFDYPASSPIARFIMISPGLTFTNGGVYSYAAGTAHYNWVSNTIDSARAAGIKWVIVGMHKVCITMGTMLCEVGNDIMNLLVSKKVDLILQAHDHDYQRSKQLGLNGTTCTAISSAAYNSNCVVNDGSTGNYTQGAGPVVVIVGTVGEPLFSLNTAAADAGYFAKWMGNNINPTNGLAKFTLSSDQLSVSANFTGSTAPNNFTDSFTVTNSTATPTPTPTPQPGGGISLRAAAIGNNGLGGSTLTIGQPAGTTSGDVMIAHVIVRTAANVITPPPGWNLVLRQDSGSAISTASYVKVAGSLEPATFTWSFGTGGEASGGIASYMGVNTTAPVDAKNAQYNLNTSNVDNSGVTTTTANDMLVYAVGIIVATTVNVPSGFTEQWHTSSRSQTTSEMSQEIFASTGATGTIHGTHNGGANSNITMLIALEPAGATSTPTPTPTSTSTPTPTPTSTPTPQPGGGIALRTTAAGNNGAGSSTLTIGLPAGTQSGDVMVAHLIVQTAGNSIAAPPGWNLVLRQDSASAIATATYVKVAGSSEPASYTWNFGKAGEAIGGIASYIGVNTTTPVDAAHAQYNNSTSNVDNSGLTTTVANDMLVYAVGIAVATTVNVPSGFTQVYNNNSNSALTSEMSQEIFASTGATGTIHGTHNGGSNSNITMLIALEPAGATPPPPPSGISLRAAAIGNNGAGGSTLTIGLPAGTQSDDVMVAFVVVRQANNTITPPAPAGWIRVQQQNTSSSLATAMYEKVAGSSEPTNYMWSFSISGEASGWIASYIGVNTTTPVDAKYAQYNVSTSNVDNSGLTTTVANDMLVYAVGIVAATSVNDPAGFTEKAYTASNSLTTAEMSQNIFASVGTTGTIHGTLNVSNSNITQLIALPTPPSGISLRATAIGNNGAGGSTLTIGLPPGTTSGDVMVAFVVVQTAGNAITPPVGWNPVLRQDSSASIATATYVKVAGSSEPATYTWSFGTAGETSGGIASYMGVNTTTPVDASNAQYNSSTSNVDNTGVTTTTANDMLVYVVGIAGATTVNVPSGFIEQWSTSSSSLTTSEMSQEIFASTGATGTIHGTLNGGANDNITQLIALKPA